MSPVRARSYQDEPMTPRSATSSSLPTLLMPSSPSSQSDNPDETFLKPRRRISFDERVSVREYDSNSWVSVKDMEQLSPLGSRERTLVSVPKIIVCGRDSASHQTDLAVPIFPGIHDRQSSTPLSLSHLLRKEIRTILMIDPHDIFLTLFSKRLQESLPHVRILKAHSSEEALQLLARRTFDVIITEERLSLFHKHSSSNKLGSGSALLNYLRNNHPTKIQHALLIGVSAHWQSDHATMAQSGTDYCWSKAPPPTLNRSLLEEMLHTLLLKRGQHELAKEFMMVSSGTTEAVNDNQKQ